jgi:hypothetical protein
MKSKAIILILFVAALGAIVYINRGKIGGNAAPPGGAVANQPTAPLTEIEFAYGTEKEAWVKAAVETFNTANPRVKVKLTPIGSLEAAQAILNGTLKPTVWGPADSLVLNLLASDWQTKTGAALFAASGDDAVSARPTAAAMGGKTTKRSTAHAAQPNAASTTPASMSIRVGSKRPIAPADSASSAGRRTGYS